MKYLLSIIIIFVVFVPGLVLGQTTGCDGKASITTNPKNVSLKSTTIVKLTIKFDWNDPKCKDEKIDVFVKYDLPPQFGNRDFIESDFQKRGLTGDSRYVVDFEYKFQDSGLFRQNDVVIFNLTVVAGKSVSRASDRISVIQNRLYCAYVDAQNRNICVQGSDSEVDFSKEGCVEGRNCPRCDANYPSACDKGCVALDVRQCGEGQGETKYFCSYTKDSQVICPARGTGKNDNTIGQQCGGDGKSCPACSTAYQDCDKNGGCKIALEIKCSDFKGGSYVCNNNKACVLKSGADPNSYSSSATEYNNIDSCAKECEEYVCKPNEGCFRSSTVSQSGSTNASLPKYSNYDTCNKACTGSTSGGGNIKSGPQDNSSYDFEIKNPIKAETFGELFKAVYSRLFLLILPLAVIVIVYSGILMTTSVRDIKQYEKGKEYLQYAILALIIIFIGRGFISLFQSIFNFLFK